MCHIQLVKALIDEFMPLFTSQYFNICADETFDLGKGKSAALAEEKGTQRLYLDFVKELCEYVVSKGKTPMFWGDIICEFPEAVQELPKETICLNWGYDADWPEDSTRKLSEAGARLYNCPGVSGWDQLVNQIRVSYENISRMCQYASNYHAEGLLNTDWGDCGHINHPDFSLPGMIYGAAFSWNLEIPEFEDINRQISRVAYGDETETLASVLARISESWKFTWRNMVDFLEQDGLKLAQMGNPTDRKALLDELEKLVKIEEPAVYQQAAQELETIQQELYAAVSHLPVGRRGKIRAYLIAVQGMILLQKIGAVLADFIALMEAQGKEPAEDQAVQSDINMENDIKRIPEHQETENAHREEQWNLAEDLEYWLYDYKKLWRSVSKEAELHRIEHVICQYADWLRVFDKICD